MSSTKRGLCRAALRICAQVEVCKSSGIPCTRLQPAAPALLALLALHLALLALRLALLALRLALLALQLTYLCSDAGPGCSSGRQMVSPPRPRSGRRGMHHHPHQPTWHASSLSSAHVACIITLISPRGMHHHSHQPTWHASSISSAHVVCMRCGLVMQCHVRMPCGLMMHCRADDALPRGLMM